MQQTPGWDSGIVPCLGALISNSMEDRNTRVVYSFSAMIMELQSSLLCSQQTTDILQQYHPLNLLNQFTLQNQQLEHTNT